MSSAVAKAATIEPPFFQRKFKYRKAIGIGTGSLTEVDSSIAIDEHGYASLPDKVFELRLYSLLLRIVISALTDGSEARFMCINDPKVGYVWARALADRTGEFLKESGASRLEVEVLKARG
ncbi:hypothetical protein C5E45_20060 [Nocardia nova]|uniref:Uncharacterized protein n=1 Tax=Nocardia nova TaxID=37330 RepID=A0A2S6AM84_9NOCA|nr:hypothetical protein C5E45_20060 [Nocardia nova]